MVARSHYLPPPQLQRRIYTVQPIIGEAYAMGGTGGCGTCAKVLYFGLYLWAIPRNQGRQCREQPAHSPETTRTGRRTYGRSGHSSPCSRTDRSNSAPKTPSLLVHPARSHTLHPSLRETAAGIRSTPWSVSYEQQKHQHAQLLCTLMVTHHQHLQPVVIQEAR